MSKKKRTRIVEIISGMTLLLILINAFPLSKGVQLLCYGANDSAYAVRQHSYGFPFTFFKSHAGDSCVVQNNSLNYSAGNYSFSLPTFGFDLVFAGAIVFICSYGIEYLRGIGGGMKT